MDWNVDKLICNLMKERDKCMNKMNKYDNLQRDALRDVEYGKALGLDRAIEIVREWID